MSITLRVRRSVQRGVDRVIEYFDADERLVADRTGDQVGDLDGPPGGEGFVGRYACRQRKPGTDAVWFEPWA